MKYFGSVKTDPKDPEKEWEDILKSESNWRMPPNWTRVFPESKGIWSKIKNIPSKVYEFFVVRISYEDYFASQLRSRYMDVQGNFRTTFNNKKDILDSREFKNNFDFIKELLILSKGILEKEKFAKTDLLTASSLLDEAEERMVWILPRDIKKAKVRELDYQIDKFSPHHKNEFQKLITNYLKNSAGQREDSIFNADIEEIIRAINKNRLADRIDTGLQIERLRSLRFWGFILLFIFIWLYPVVSNIDTWERTKFVIQYWEEFINNTHIQNITKESPFLLRRLGPYFSLTPEGTLAGWAIALGFSIVGGIAGFISGLLQVRTSKTNLELYEEAVLLFQIRPIFGAFAALITFMLLSWGALGQPTEGVIIITIFASGFSERYFLHLLKLNIESREPKKDGFGEGIDASGDSINGNDIGMSPDVNTDGDAKSGVIDKVGSFASSGKESEDDKSTKETNE